MSPLKGQQTQEHILLFREKNKALAQKKTLGDVIHIYVQEGGNVVGTTVYFPKL